MGEPLRRLRRHGQRDLRQRQGHGGPVVKHAPLTRTSSSFTPLQVSRFVLAETLGKLPLFASQLDPEFQLAVFPLIKPVSYSEGDIIFRRGDPSRDLIFLLKGEGDGVPDQMRESVADERSRQRTVKLPIKHYLSCIDRARTACFSESTSLTFSSRTSSSWSVSCSNDCTYELPLDSATSRSRQW